MKKQSQYLENASFRIKNRKWLKYSSNVARRIYAAMNNKDKKLTQKELAELVDVKPQYISKVLKGDENLSLMTIAKFSDVLGVELISFPEYKYSNAYVLSKNNDMCKVVNMYPSSFNYNSPKSEPLVLNN